MNLFSQIEIPKFVCQFENYTKSVEVIQILIYLFAMWGILHFFYWLYGLVRIGGFATKSMWLYWCLKFDVINKIKRKGG